MKKTIFLGFAALLALAVFSCGDPSLPKNEVGITLSVKDSEGRALTGPIAQAGTNFYEAVFRKDSATSVRTTWNYARTGKIQIDPGTYQVILMAGRNADKTLLGVGTATNIVGGGTITSPPSVTIISSTTKIEFTVYALINNINGDGDTTDATTTTTFTTPSSDGTVKLNPTKDELGNDVPVFMLTKNAPIAGEDIVWKFGLGDFPGGDDDQLTETPSLGSFVFTTGTPQIFVTGFAFPDSLDRPQSLVGTPTFASLPATLAAGTITMNVRAPNDDGMVQLAFEVPVISLYSSDDSLTDKPVTWYVRGGLYNGLIDAGITPTLAKSGVLGGAIVLGFGNLTNFPVIELTPKTWEP